ncbi:small kinetochore-associated protein isoform X2 [Synchiropus splendidus]|uniref:small kinetochore-associated protein isoform X2 n=1 Tax=Synchiropus splendidus TaxID=270530 RepID=UPI00237E94AA|nr:small kinetochore-associated protein isoform X2 [Synchiropus splendidus]
MASKLPRGESKRPENKRELKDAGAVTTTNAAPKEVAPKQQKENAARKNAPSKVYKGVSTRYELQAELKEQNRNLSAANEQLQSKLTESQLRVEELELQFVEMEKEKVEVQRKLTRCHVLLVAAKLDPGERVGEAAEEHKEQREEVNRLSAELLSELQNFGTVASQQRLQLQELEGQMRALAVARDHMTRERENFCEDVAEVERALQEAEALLM